MLGEDGRENGLLNGYQVRALFREGRANAQTPLRRDPEDADGWRPLAEFPEFADFQKIYAPAMASYVLAILSIVLCLGPLAGLPAIICGHIARHQIKKSQGRLHGDDHALAGLIAGYISSVLFTLLFIYVQVPPFAAAEDHARRVTCVCGLKELGTACKMYASDNHDAFPPDFAALIKGQYITGFDNFICRPASGSKPAESMAEFDRVQFQDYAYYGAGQTENTAGTKTILIAERCGHHRDWLDVLFGNSHITVVFGDAHVETGLVKSVEEFARQKGYKLPTPPPAKAP